MSLGLPALAVAGVPDQVRLRSHLGDAGLRGPHTTQTAHKRRQHLSTNASQVVNSRIADKQREEAERRGETDLQEFVPASECAWVSILYLLDFLAVCREPLVHHISRPGTQSPPQSSGLLGRRRREKPPPEPFCTAPGNMRNSQVHGVSGFLFLRTPLREAFCPGTFERFCGSYSRGC